MGFIVGFFLTYMEEESAFFMFDSLIKNYGFGELLLSGFPKLKSILFVYLNLLKKFMPTVYEFFKNQKFPHSYYAAYFFIYMFSNKLKFNVLARVFDVFLLEGYKIVYRVALALIKINKEKFLKKGVEDEYLYHLFKNKFDEIDPELLLETAFNLRFSKEDIKKYEDEYEKVKDNPKNEFIKQL